MHRWIELMQLAHEPRIEVTWKNLADIFQCDNANGTGLNSTNNQC